MSEHSNTNMEECGLKACSEDIDVLNNSQKYVKFISVWDEFIQN